MEITKSLSFRDLYASGEKLSIDLSLSENPLGCSPRVIVALKRFDQRDLFDYPDPDCNQLRLAIARRFYIEVSNIFMANGSEAIIKLLTQTLLNPEDEVIIPKLTFPMFEIASRMSGAKVVLLAMTASLAINLKDMQSKINSKTKLIFLCNPNNPTGKIISKKEIITFVKSTKAMVVVDEANIEFGGESVIEETRKLKNLIVLRTFSKGFGLAGLRIGFCVANQKVVRRLQQVNQLFSVSTMAEKAALIAFADREFIKKTKIFMAGEIDFLSCELKQRDFRVIASQANNLLAQVTPHFSSSTDFVRKLREKGVSVVDGIAFKGLGNNFVRLSPRSHKINKQFLKIVDELMDI